MDARSICSFHVSIHYPIHGRSVAVHRKILQEGRAGYRRYTRASHRIELCHMRLRERVLRLLLYLVPRLGCDERRRRGMERRGVRRVVIQKADAGDISPYDDESWCGGWSSQG